MDNEDSSEQPAKHSNESVHQQEAATISEGSLTVTAAKNSRTKIESPEVGPTVQDRTFASGVRLRQIFKETGLTIWLLVLSVMGAVGAFWFLFWATGVSVSRYIGDYRPDADVALRGAMHGDILGMYGTVPAPLMLPLALLARLPALLIGQGLGVLNASSGAILVPGKGYILLHPVIARYEWGAIGLLAVGSFCIMMVGWHLSNTWRLRVGALVFALFMLVSPLTDNALKWGHPEEMLGASLLLAAFMAIAGKKWILALCLFAAAGAVKQPFLLALPTAAFMVPSSSRKKAWLMAFAVGAVLILPFLAPHLGELLKANTGQLQADSGNSNYVDSIFYAFDLKQFRFLARPLILVLAILPPLWLAFRKPDRWFLRPVQGASLITLVMIARCVLDPFNISYYALPILGALAGLEWIAWSRKEHPLQKSARLRTWDIPFPFFALIAGILLSGASGGFIDDFITNHQISDIYGPVYVGVCVLIAVPLMFFALGRTIQVSSARVKLYGGAAAVIGFLILSLALFSQPTQQRPNAQVPSEYQSASLATIYQKTQPSTVYWLGAGPLPNGDYLRGQGYSRGLKTRNLLNSIFDYGPVEGYTGATVFTSQPGKLGPAFLGQIKNCRGTVCRNGWKLIPAPAGIPNKTGKVLYYTYPNGDWETRIPLGDGHLGIYIITFRNRPTVQEAFRLLQPLTAAQAARQTTYKQPPKRDF